MKSKDFVILGIAVAIYLLWKNSKTTTTTGTISTGTGTTGGVATSEGGVKPTGTTITPTSNEPEQIFGASLPSGMDLPVLTAGTGTPTEVGVQEGLGNTTPTPVIVQTPVLAIEESLVLGGIKPIKRDETVQTEVLQGTPIIKQEPKIKLAEFKN
jgi:hypothetical protein